MNKFSKNIKDLSKCSCENNVIVTQLFVLHRTCVFILVGIIVPMPFSVKLDIATFAYVCLLCHKILRINFNCIMFL